MRKRSTPEDGGFGAESSRARIDPDEVQRKEFRVARFGGGYRMREVDEFLDQITETLTSLIAENERLSTTGSSAGSSAPVPGPATSGRDRAAVDAFLQRERGFLQSLGGLVQEHAEELRVMVRAVRREAPPTAPAEPAEPAAASSSVSAPSPEPVSASPGEAEGERVAAEAPEAVAVEQPTADAGSTPDEADGEATRAMAHPEPEQTPAPEVLPDPGELTEPGELPGSGKLQEEPIRLDEPEAARSGRREDGTEGSLRELFWGED